MLSRCVMSRVKHNSYFLVGLGIGLWLALAVVPLEEAPEACAAGAVQRAPPGDDLEPRREQRPLSGGAPPARPMQRPRYYSTELGMRSALLAAVLSTQAALPTRAAALNRTAARLQPALRFFITASTVQDAPGLANVVGFTDTREMLKPFHALKYLADNYLEEYNFFFLVSDVAYVNARRLTELVSKLSVSRDVYMGVVGGNDSHYCLLEGGILLSNTVLRAVHNELDWCVRNSYSPHHYENIGRCVLHAANIQCTDTLQGERYVAALLEGAEPGAGAELGGALRPALVDAVTVRTLALAAHYYQLHAYVSRIYLERDAAETRRLRSAVWRGAGRLPRGYRNATWPGGLRADVGLAPPLPDNRFDYLRWTSFNETHALMPDDHRAVGPLAGAHKQAVDLVVDAARAWALTRWPSARSAVLADAAWRWEPPTALRYRLLVRLTADTGTDQRKHTLRQLEVVRPLGAARLVPVPYVTESARVALVLPVLARDERDVVAALRTYETVALRRDKNTALVMALVRDAADNATCDAPCAETRAAVAALAARYRTAQLDVVEGHTHYPLSGASGETAWAVASRGALAAALIRAPRDALVLLVPPHADYNEDFLNRVRMNTICGAQWFLAGAFARHAQYAHPRFVDADGRKPQVNTGRFNLHAHHALAFCRKDYEQALSEWHQSGGAEDAGPAAILARSTLRCVRAPEPGLVLSPRPAPCAALAGAAQGGARAACLRAERDSGFAGLDLGAKQALARLLLETQAEMT